MLLLAWRLLQVLSSAEARRFVQLDGADRPRHSAATRAKQRGHRARSQQHELDISLWRFRESGEVLNSQRHQSWVLALGW